MKKILLFLLLFGICFSSLVSQELTSKPEGNLSDFVIETFLGHLELPTNLPQKQGHIFSNIGDEYKLVSYFFNSNQKRYYKTLSYEHKWQYLSTFWKVQDINPTTDHNEFQQEIIVRIEYSNKHFSHFKEGWKTDMGKVYIKYGEPFEILKLTNYKDFFEIIDLEGTGIYTKLAFREYQIWKYRLGIYQTFLFIEPQQHKDFRLIFSDGEEQYGSWEEWLEYLGLDFKAKLLR
jgi:GWxTD domain-containing protein